MFLYTSPFWVALLLPRDGLGLFQTRALGAQIKRSACQLGSTTLYFSSVK